MLRRDTFKLLPLSVFSLALSAGRVFGETSTVERPGTEEKGPLAVRYIDRVLKMLRRIRETQSSNLLEGAYAIARTVENGGQCWSNWDMGHNYEYDLYTDRNGEPEIFKVGYDEKTSKPGDLFLVSLYGGKWDDILAKKLFVIGGPAPHMADNIGDEELRDEVKTWVTRPYSNLWIETFVTRQGAIMEIPGSEVKAGPVSGILGMTTFWMMMSDACRILARDSHPVKVKGDEPVLKNDPVPDWDVNARVSLDDTLMDNYFDILTSQIARIPGELGEIRRAAKMCVDTVFSGGNVYCYSRYRNQLAVEGNTRRGGLAMFNGIYDGGAEKDFNYVHAFFEGRPLSSKDCVIMGFTRPDDPVDIKNFDKFRRIGMKVATIGPETRDFVIPTGRTIPKESDIYLGSMCDTHGLFAIKGFEKKVCPTSGAIVNLLYWATCMEIIEQFMERTGGDVPGIFANVALKRGRIQMKNTVELYKDRGY